MPAVVREYEGMSNRSEDRFSNFFFYGYGGPESGRLFDWPNHPRPIDDLAALPIIMALDFSDGGYNAGSAGSGKFESKYDTFMRNGYPDLARQAQASLDALNPSGN